MKILYVENYAIYAATVVRTFLRDHRVTVVPSLAAARSALAGGDFDVVIVDYDLDDGKGDVLVAELVKRQQSRPRIVASSSNADGNAALSRAGADAVCSKLRFAQINEILRGLFSGDGTTDGAPPPAKEFRPPIDNEENP